MNNLLDKLIIICVVFVVSFAAYSLFSDSDVHADSGGMELTSPANDSDEACIEVSGLRTRIPCKPNVKSIHLLGSPDAGSIIVGGKALRQGAAGGGGGSPITLNAGQDYAVAQRNVYVSCVSGTDAGCYHVCYSCKY